MVGKGRRRTRHLLCSHEVTPLLLDLVKGECAGSRQVIRFLRLCQVWLPEKWRRLLEGGTRVERSQALSIGQTILGLIEVSDNLAILFFDNRRLVECHRFLLCLQIEARLAHAAQIQSLLICRIERAALRHVCRMCLQIIAAPLRVVLNRCAGGIAPRPRSVNIEALVEGNHASCTCSGIKVLL